MPTPGHTAGHLAVLVQNEGLTYFFAGDTSYTEQALLDQVVDGVSPDRELAQQTLRQTLDFGQHTPTIYLPSHDPAAAERLAARRLFSPSTRIGSSNRSILAAFL